MPNFKHQANSKDVLHSNDIIYIISANSDFQNKIPYLHAGIQGKDGDPLQSGFQDKAPETKSMARGNPNDQPQELVEVNVSLEKRTKIRIKEFHKVITHDALNDILRCGDIIWLNHSEYDTSLSGV